LAGRMMARVPHVAHPALKQPKSEIKQCC